MHEKELLFLIKVAFCLYLLVYMYRLYNKKQNNYVSHNIQLPSSTQLLPKTSTCGLNNSSCGLNNSSCSAIDDVNNPAYNMENVIKQIILLEEHLAEDNKYCKPCCVKHFLHIIGLVEEAIWMAGKNKEKYPLMLETLNLFNAQYKVWIQALDDNNIRLDVLSIIRAHRQKLIEIYVLKK